MPRISEALYNEQQVQLNPLPGPRLDTRPQTNAAIEFGQAAQEIGSQWQKIALKEQELQDDLRVEESLNALREKQLDLTLNPQSGYSQQLGKNAIQRQSGQALSDEYMGQFNTVTQDLAKSLATERQRQKFGQRAAILGTEFRSGLMRHEGAQIKAYANGVDEGVVKVEIENAARNWSDPAAVETALARVDGAIERKRQREGVAAEMVTDVRRDARSAIHRGALMGALGAKNFKFVDDYLKNNAGDLNAKDLLEIQTIYRKEDVSNFAVVESTRVIREAEQRSAPTVYNSLMAAMAAQESNNRQYASNGQTITSPKGALGVMQVMPGTGPEAAKLAGEEWSLDRLKTDEAYNRRLGEAYMREQLKQNRGDVGKALAAYNAGPGALSKALTDAAKAGKPDDWLARLPPETQDYVAKITRSVTGGAAPQRPSLLDLEREIERRAGGDLEKRRAGSQEVQRQYQALEAQRRQRENETLDAAFKELDRNGGNYEALPFAMRNAIPGDKLGTVRGFAKSAAKRAAGQDNETNLAAYLQLSDERYLKTLSTSDFYAFRSELSEADFKHFTNEYRKATGAAVQNKLEDLNSSYIKQILDNRLRGILIDPNNKNSTEQQRVGAIRRYVDQEILAEQKASGQKLTDAQIQNKIDALFALDERFRKNYFGLFRYGEENRKLLSATVKDIPDDVRKTIEAGFKARGITPSDQDLLTVYLRTRTAQSR